MITHLHWWLVPAVLILIGFLFMWWSLHTLRTSSEMFSGMAEAFVAVLAICVGAAIALSHYL